MSWFGATGGAHGARSPRPAVRFGDAAWWHVLGFDGGPPRSLPDVERRFRRLAARLHPDRGGSAEQMQQLIRAREQARRQLVPRA